VHIVEQQGLRWCSFQASRAAGYAWPSVEALSSAFRAITFLLCDEPSADFASDSSRAWFLCRASGRRLISAALNARLWRHPFGGLRRAAFCLGASRPDRGLSRVDPDPNGLRRRHEIRPPALSPGPAVFAETLWRLRRETPRHLKPPACLRGLAAQNAFGHCCRCADGGPRGWWRRATRWPPVRA
jgi:hypothetical protein